MKLFFELFGEAIANVLYLVIVFGSTVIFCAKAEHMTVKQYIDWMNEDEDD